MRKVLPALVVAVVLTLIGADLLASGPVGIYGIVEKVVFEPNEQAAERVQVWGVFAYVDGAAATGLTISTMARGYLYFKIPAVIAGFTSQTDVVNARREWADLKAVAATGQAIGFGRWDYIGGFSDLRPDARSYTLERTGRGGATADLRVRPASETPASPVTYQTNVGIVKLAENGSHAAIVKQLRSTVGK